MLVSATYTHCLSCLMIVQCNYCLSFLANFLIPSCVNNSSHCLQIWMYISKSRLYHFVSFQFFWVAFRLLFHVFCSFCFPLPFLCVIKEHSSCTPTFPHYAQLIIVWSLSISRLHQISLTPLRFLF